MKYLFLINKHSFVDVITNSSSELFVLDKNKSIEQIKEVINHLIAGYNAYQDNEPEDFEAMFGEIEIIDEKNYIDIMKIMLTYNAWKPKDGELYVHSFEYHDLHRQEYYKKHTKKEWKKLHDEEEKKGKAYIKKYSKEFLEEHKGKVAIHSAGNNSIPWGIQQFIEDTFHARRIHLG